MIAPAILQRLQPCADVQFALDIAPVRRHCIGRDAHTRADLLGAEELHAQGDDIAFDVA